MAFEGYLRLIYLPQQFLYFLPLPHGHGSFLPTFRNALGGRGSLALLDSSTKSILSADGHLYEKVVLPSLFVTAKSPRVIISIPIRTSASLIVPSVTLSCGKETRFGRKILTK